jgi:iron(III) transport system ATP-binding protein
VNSLTPDKRDTAMVFQSYALFPHLNLFDNVAYGLKIKKLTKDVIAQKVKDILAMVGLEGMATRAPNQLSGGQQQRVALARALVMEPSVLLFDEPLSNLDAKLRIYMRNEIHKIQRKVGITSIYVTHDQSEAMSLSDRIIVMKAGQVEQMGTPHEIYAQPATPFVADFIGMANITPGKVTAAINGDQLAVEFLGITATKRTTANLKPATPVRLSPVRKV